MSHGNGGSLLSRFDTAIALADAGFVVVAVTHTGDNYADQSRNLNVMGRSRHISRSIDHLLLTWDARETIDPVRIGIFGMSSGGFTALTSIGAIADDSEPEMDRVLVTTRITFSTAGFRFTYARRRQTTSQKSWLRLCKKLSPWKMHAPL